MSELISREAALDAIQGLRHSAACTFTPGYSGALGEARCNSFYEAYQAVKDLPPTAPLGAPQAALPVEGEVEGLIDEFSHELIQLGSAPFDNSVDMQATHRRVFELRTALLAAISPTPARQEEGRTLRALLDRAKAQGGRTEATYQDRSAAWMGVAFAADPTDGPERRDRATEEVCEGYQSDGGTLDDWIAIGRYTFGRQAGALPKEIGQIVFTVACWAAFRGIDIMAEAERELTRCSTPEFIEKLARKRATRHGRGPLPGFSGPETSAPGIDLSCPDANSGGEAPGRDDGWQPIETAPKDGRYILVSDGLHVDAARYSHGSFGGFLRDGDTLHWQPLPAPPASPRSSQKEQGE